MSDNIFATTLSKKHYKVTGSDAPDSLFPDLDLSNPQPFSKKYLAEEGEILYIELKDNDLLLIQPFANNFLSTADSNIIPANCYEQVNLLYMGTKNSNESYDIKFQRIWNRYYFKKGCFSLSFDSCKIIKNSSLIMLTGNTDVFWDANAKRLYFKNFRTAKSIFPKLEKFYRQANEEDLKRFANHPLIAIPANKKFGERALGKIAMMIDEKSLDNKVLSDLQAYANEYKQEMPAIENNKIVISTNKEVDLLYKLVNELFFTTLRSQEKRAANSFQKI